MPNPVLSEDASYGKYEPEKVNEEKQKLRLIIGIKIFSHTKIKI